VEAHSSQILLVHNKNFKVTKDIANGIFPLSFFLFPFLEFASYPDEMIFGILRE